MPIFKVTTHLCSMSTRTTNIKADVFMNEGSSLSFYNKNKDGGLERVAFFPTGNVLGVVREGCETE